MNKKPNPRKLSIPVGFELGTISGDDPGQKCECHICELASLSGGKLKTFLAGLSPSAEFQGSEMRRCNTCFGPVTSGQAHKGCGSKQVLLKNLKAALPLATRQQFALETLRETEELQGGGAGDSAVIHLQSHRGGKPTEVTLGRQKNAPDSVLTLPDARSMQMRHNFTQAQLKGVLADFRCLNGRQSVEPYIMERILQSKEELKAFFHVELVNFLAKDQQGCIFL